MRVVAGTDGELLEVCRRTELGFDERQEAFRQIVERYQNLVCSITYSAGGDRALSEDLAQETFLSAWKSLHTLGEPHKLRAWLCTVARNKVRDWVRARGRDLPATSVDAEHLESLAAGSGEEPDAEGELIREEEATLVWRALEEIPESYREPMVLYYREGQSSARVATSLGISEEAARARLSRGRAALKREVTSLVEQILSRSKPGKAFTVAVVAALPALVPQAAAAAAVTVAGKGSAVAKAAGWAALGGAVLGPLLGLLGGAFGVWQSYRAAESDRERSFVVRMAVGIVLLVAVFLTLLFGAIFGLTGAVRGYAIAGLSLAYGVVLVATIFVANRKQRRIQIEEGSSRDPVRRWYATPEDRLAGRLSPAAIHQLLGGVVFGSVAWMAVFALLAGDLLGLAVVIACAAGMFLLGSRRLAARGRDAFRSVLLSIWGGVSLMTLAALNLRLFDWLSGFGGGAEERIREFLPLPVVNASAIALLVGVGLALLSRHVAPPE